MKLYHNEEHNVNLREKQKNHHFVIEVDGGVTLDNAAQIAEAGADMLVAGSAVFDRKATKENAEAFVKLFQEIRVS